MYCIDKKFQCELKGKIRKSVQEYTLQAIKRFFKLSSCFNIIKKKNLHFTITIRINLSLQAYLNKKYIPTKLWLCKTVRKTTRMSKDNVFSHDQRPCVAKRPRGEGGGDILPNLYCTFYTIKEGTKGEDFLLTVYSLHLQPIRCKEGRI